MPWYAVRPASPETTVALLAALRPRASAVHVTVRGEVPEALRAGPASGSGRGPVGRLLAWLEPDSGSGPARRRVTVRPDRAPAWAALLDLAASGELDIEVIADHRLIARVAGVATPVAELTGAEHAHLVAALGTAAVEDLPTPPAWYRLGRG
jgi:hypothetical protein